MRCALIVLWFLRLAPVLQSFFVLLFLLSSVYAIILYAQPSVSHLLRFQVFIKEIGLHFLDVSILHLLYIIYIGGSCSVMWDLVYVCVCVCHCACVVVLFIWIFHPHSSTFLHPAIQAPIVAANKRRVHATESARPCSFLCVTCTRYACACVCMCVCVCALCWLTKAKCHRFKYRFSVHKCATHKEFPAIGG